MTGPVAAVKRAALIILDGWGDAPAGPGYAISLADTPVWDSLIKRYPQVLLEASGEAVGLPAGVMGNSEVGHLTIGSGRIIHQDLSRINHAIADGSFFENEVLRAAMDGAVQHGKAVHLMGLLSEGGVHSSIAHVKSLVSMAHRRGASRVLIHAFTDGRDTSPTAGEGYVEDLQLFLEQEGLGNIVTIAGRYYAMDRDRRWNRVKTAYEALVRNKGLHAPDAMTAIRQSYTRNETDEFVTPTVIGEGSGTRIASGDAVIFFNFRPDRARELSAALTQEDFAGFKRGRPLPQVDLVCMTEYDARLKLPVAFPKVEPAKVLAEVISEAGRTQLHIAETEKYAHVTFFFNGGREQPFPGEQRILIPSPKEVATYDQKPEMSAPAVADCLVETVAAAAPDFVILNFANPDMVGHTGDIPATVEAVQVVDRCLGQVVEALAAVGAKVMITADHGNAEAMLEPDGSVNTAHTTNPVPLIVLEEGAKLREGAGLSDLAPTILQFMGLEIPVEMTGQPVIEV
jgi:2,3-bisphosphoglycerate-independent phosphoglycerate mutase